VPSFLLRLDRARRAPVRFGLVATIIAPGRRGHIGREDDFDEPGRRIFG